LASDITWFTDPVRAEVADRPSVVAVYCIEDALTRRVKHALVGHSAVIAISDWSDFHIEGKRSDCAVVAARWLAQDNLVGRLADFRLSSTVPPLTIVTTSDADNVRAISAVSVNAIVWLHEIENQLVEAIRGATIGGHLRCLADAIVRPSHLTTQLRQILSIAFRSPPATLCLTQIAMTLSCHRRTLWYQWARAVGNRSALRMEDVISWLLLIHAVGRKTPLRSWAGVAAELSVHEHTLARSAARYMGVPLAEMQCLGQWAILGKFERELSKALALNINPVSAHNPLRTKRTDCSPC
jgi:hypothetical protein